MNDVTATDPFELALGPDAELPSEWTSEHVARRLIEAFETLMQMPGSVGPRMDANGWPSMLQEFADLVDEEAMTNARAAFVKARRRPSAERIARMDDALAWPLRFGEGEPLACDAVLLWSFCKAGGFSIAGILRRRTAWAKLIAGNMTIAENNRRQIELRRETDEILAWAERMAEERGLRGRAGADLAEGRTRLFAAAKERHANARARHAPVIVTPHEARPEKVLSRTSLDRHLPRGLALMQSALRTTNVPVR